MDTEYPVDSIATSARYRARMASDCAAISKHALQTSFQANRISAYMNKGTGRSPSAVIESQTGFHRSEGDGSMAIALVSSLPLDTASTGNRFASAAAAQAGYAKQQATPMDLESPGPMPSPGQIAQAVRQVNDSFGKKGQDLVAFVERDEETGIDVVKVVEKGTDEVIRQFPSEEIIQIARTIDQAGEGKLSLLRVSA